jgi:hypothetical protein
MIDIRVEIPPRMRMVFRFLNSCAIVRRDLWRKFYDLLDQSKVLYAANETVCVLMSVFLGNAGKCPADEAEDSRGQRIN